MRAAVLRVRGYAVDALFAVVVLACAWIMGDLGDEDPKSVGPEYPGWLWVVFVIGAFGSFVLSAAAPCLVCQ